MTTEFFTNIHFNSITLFNTQNVMETRLTKLYYSEAAELKNDRNFQLSSSFRVTVMA